MLAGMVNDELVRVAWSHPFADCTVAAITRATLPFPRDCRQPAAEAIVDLLLARVLLLIYREPATHAGGKSTPLAAIELMMIDLH